MDNQDKEFESFLRQFRLRQPAAFEGLIAEPGQKDRQTHRWILAAAAVIVVALVSASLLRNMVLSSELVATVEAAGDSSYRLADKIAAGSRIHAGASDGLVLGLKGGSEIEMRAQSELSLEMDADSVRIELSRGSVLVTVSKQGPLYVETRDMRVSAPGTVFFVDLQTSGTRVGVIEGEVEMQQGTTVRRLLAGEQASTDPSIEAQPLVDALSWSRRARKLAPLVKTIPTPAPLPQIAPVRSAPPSPREIQSAAVRQEQPQQPPPAAPPEPQQQPAGPGEPGQKIFNRACSTCHSTSFMDTQHYSTREAYSALVSGEIAKGAAISGPEMPGLVDYLFKTYGASKKYK